MRFHYMWTWDIPSTFVFVCLIKVFIRFRITSTPISRGENETRFWQPFYFREGWKWPTRSGSPWVMPTASTNELSLERTWILWQKGGLWNRWPLSSQVRCISVFTDRCSGVAISTFQLVWLFGWFLYSWQALKKCDAGYSKRSWMKSRIGCLSFFLCQKLTSTIISNWCNEPLESQDGSWKMNWKRRLPWTIILGSCCVLFFHSFMKNIADDLGWSSD